VNLQIGGFAVQRFSVSTGSTGLDAGIFSVFATTGGVAAIQ
jgi:hypothetical protein